MEMGMRVGEGLERGRKQERGIRGKEKKEKGEKEKRKAVVGEEEVAVKGEDEVEKERERACKRRDSRIKEGGRSLNWRKAKKIKEQKRQKMNDTRSTGCIVTDINILLFTLSPTVRTAVLSY
jgi:hypothetical protein